MLDQIKTYTDKKVFESMIAVVKEFIIQYFYAVDVIIGVKILFKLRGKI